MDNKKYIYVCDDHYHSESEEITINSPRHSKCEYCEKQANHLVIRNWRYNKQELCKNG